MNENEKKYNKIAYRLETIQDLVKDKTVDSILDFEGENEEEDSINNSEDIRHLLPYIRLSTSTPNNFEV